VPRIPVTSADFWNKAIQCVLAGPRRIVNALFGYDFFISYAHDDGEDYPQALDKALSEKYTVHLDTRDYRVGQDLRVLTRLRVRNSRLLVVVGRSHALTRSYWVRREVEMFHNGGREPVVIDVDGSIESALATPPNGSLAAWFADNRESREDGTPIYPMLLEIDSVQPPIVGPRLPQQRVIQRLQERFTGDRVESKRLRIVTGALVVLILATTGAVWQTFVAEQRRGASLRSLAQATSDELASRARVMSANRPDLALVLATRSIDLARKNSVSWTEGASALRDIANQTRGARTNCLQGGEGQSIDYSASIGLVAVATDNGTLCLFRRDKDGALRLLDTLQSFSGGAVEKVRFSADGEWLVTLMRGGSLRVLHVGAIYKDKSSVQHGRANYRFSTFGETDIAKALSLDPNRSRVAFFSQTSGKIELWGMLQLTPTGAPITTLDPGGHVLATAFDTSGAYLAALVLENERKLGEESAWQFWSPDEHDLQGPPRFHVKVWSLPTFSLRADFAVLEQREGIYLGDGIGMGQLHGTLRVGPDAQWVAPAMFLADMHSLEPRMIAQVIHVADQTVTAGFMGGTGDRSFDGWSQVSDIGFTRDGRSFFALNDSIIRFWSLQNQGGTRPQRLRELTTPSAPAGARKSQGVVSVLSLSSDHNLLATLDSTDSLTVWDISATEANTPTEPLLFVPGIGEASHGTPTALAFSDDGQAVFFAADKGEVRACDVRNRCGPILLQHASAPFAGGQWKELFAPAHDKWIAAVSEQQTVSFFRNGNLSTPFFQAQVSETPAPVVTRGYAILSGTPGRPVDVVPSADGSWAAVFEQQQYGFNEKLRLIHLTDQPAVHEVSLASGDCDGRFMQVQFDPFAPYLIALSKFGCIAFVKLPETGEAPIVAEHPIRSSELGLGISPMTFTKNYISFGTQGQGQLWARDKLTGAPGRLLLNRSDGSVLLLPDEKQGIFVTRDGANTSNGLTHYQLTAAADLGEPISVGNYSAVKRIAISGEIAVVVGVRAGVSDETVAVWSLSALSQPLVERPSKFDASNLEIVFDSTSKRILVGPNNYSLKGRRPDPRIQTAILFDLSLASPIQRLLNIDLGAQKEGCETNRGSCYDLAYEFSPDGAWLNISRTQSFGASGPPTVWSLGGTPVPRITFPEGSDLDFDPTSHWLIASVRGEQRLWRLDANSGTLLDQGRVTSDGYSRFLRGGRDLLTLTSGEITKSTLAIDDLIARVPDFVGRNLSPAEWAALFPNMEYEQSFPIFPPDTARVSDLVNRGEVLASSGNRQEASKLFVSASKLAIQTESIEIVKMVVRSAQGVGLGSSARAAANYAAQILPKDTEIQELLRTSGQPEREQNPRNSASHDTGTFDENP
jgi:WD40 repeat protein